MADDKGLAQRDAEDVASCGFVPWEEMGGKVVVVTGATGLLGGSVVRAVAARNALFGADIRMVALVRDMARGSAVLRGVPSVNLVEWDAAGAALVPECQADYIIHCASPTASKAFVDTPVEVMRAIVGGTASMLEFARSTGARMVYVSSMEVYGKGGAGPIDESLCGATDVMAPRNSYPVAKQAAEALCAAYASEYGVWVCSARLAQTFGAGVPVTDGRVFAQFARACIAGEDIHLATAGTKENMYVYTADAVSALLLLALRGEAGCAYNVANEDTLTSVRDMARAVLDRFGRDVARVVFDYDKRAVRHYPKPGTIRLDTTRIRALGWRPTYGLMDMYVRLIESWREEGGRA